MLFGLFYTKWEKERDRRTAEVALLIRTKRAKQILRDAGICTKHRCDMKKVETARSRGEFFVCDLCQQEQADRKAQCQAEKAVIEAQKIADAKKLLGWDDESKGVSQENISQNSV